MNIPKKLTCPFCSPVIDRIITEENDWVIYTDGYPVSKGHLLILPKRHFPSILEANTQELNSLMPCILEAQQYINKKYLPNGFNIGINQGESAGQTVEHLHIHIIPRYNGDIDDPRGGVRWVLPEKADYWT